MSKKRDGRGEFNINNEAKKDCALFLLRQCLEIFKSFDILGNAEDILEVWFGSTVSLISLLLSNVREVNEIKFNEQKTLVLSLINILKNQVLDI